MISRQARTVFIPFLKSRGVEAVRSFLIRENIVQGGAASIPCTVLLLKSSMNWGYSLHLSTSKSGSVSTRTSYPASLYGLLHAPVPPHKSRMTLRCTSKVVAVLATNSSGAAFWFSFRLPFTLRIIYRYVN